MKINTNDISIEVEEYGKKDDPVILLIMGLGLQLTSWPIDFINGFVS